MEKTRTVIQTMFYMIIVAWATLVTIATFAGDHFVQIKELQNKCIVQQKQINELKNTNKLNTEALQQDIEMVRAQLVNQINDCNIKLKYHQPVIDEVRKILDEQKITARAQQMIQQQQQAQHQQQIQSQPIPKPEEKK